MSDIDSDKPFSQACENNRQPIYDVLKDTFADKKTILEIGSGTGQHAVFMAPRMHHLQWQTSDLSENVDGINRWIDDEKVVNVLRPLEIDIEKHWPNTGLLKNFDGLYTANTCHIMPWETVRKFLVGLKGMEEGSRLAIYGPFKYQGQFTSESNERFEHWLKAQEAHRGIRDFEAIAEEANKSGFELLEDHNMPANNQLLIWQKR